MVRQNQRATLNNVNVPSLGPFSQDAEPRISPMLPRSSVPRRRSARHSVVDIERSRTIRRKAPRYLGELSRMRKRLWNADVQSVMLAGFYSPRWSGWEPSWRDTHDRRGRTPDREGKQNTDDPRGCYLVHVVTELSEVTPVHRRKTKRGRFRKPRIRSVLVKTKCNAHGSNPPHSVPHSVHEDTNTVERRQWSTTFGLARRILANARAWPTTRAPDLYWVFEILW